MTSLQAGFHTTWNAAERNGTERTEIRAPGTKRNGEPCVCVCVCVCVWVCGGGKTLFPRDLGIAQFFSFKAGGASSPSSLAPTKTLDECWWYLTWSVRRTCHVTISISELCDSLTAATVLNLSLFKTCLGTTAFSRAKKRKSMSLVNRHSILQVCAFYGTRLFPTCQVRVSRFFKTGATPSPSLLLSSSPSTSSSWPCSSVCTNGLEVSNVSEDHRELHPQLGTHGPEPYRESLMQLCTRWLEHMPERSIRNARIDAKLDVRKNAK